MRKKLILLLIPLLFVILVGCNKKTNNDGEIVITYSNWNLGSVESKETSMERLMIEEFMNKYPHIKVEIIERPKVPGTDGDMAWNEFLAARASTKSLPDVFMADNIPLYVINDWAYNITELANEDPEYLKISQDIRTATTYSGKVMALPNAVHYAGYVVNKDLYDKQGKDWPTIDTDFDTLLSLTKAAANHTSNNNTGVVGFEGIEHIIHWYPAQLNKDFDWFTLTNDGFNLDSEEFAQTISLYRRLRTDTSFVLEALQDADSDENSGIDIGTIFPEGDHFDNGNILAKWFYTYDFGWIQSKINAGDYTWDLDFIGTPVVNGNKRVPIVADFFTIAANTKHPKEAYLLAKWMGFGKEGYLKRVELSKTVAEISQVNFAPLQDDKEMLDAYFSLYPDFIGLRTIIERGSVIVEPPKYLPGYNDARYGGTYDADNKMNDIILKLMAGEVNIADIAKNLNTRANQIYNISKVEFDEAIKLR